MNYYERHIGDYLKDTSHLSLLEHGIYSRLLDVYYTREGAIQEDQAARLIGARSKDERDALNAVLGEFFDLIDGQWHQSRCDAEIEAYQAKQAEKPAAKDNAKERQRRARERRSQLFEALRSHGITASYKATTVELEAELSRVKSQGVTRDVRDASQHVTRDASQGVTRDNTATQTPDTRHQTKEKESAHSIPPVFARAPDPDDPPEAQGQPPTPAGAICQAMRRAGLQATNPGDPRLLALIAQGATLAEFEGIAVEAVTKGKGWAWVLTVLPARRAEAAAISLAPAPQADPKAWLANRRGVIERGCAVGVGPWDESNAAAGTGPSWAEYRAQVIAADAAQTPQETAA